MVNRKTSFKGLEISNMDFERKRLNCSKIIKDSCSSRDCNLEIYKLGNDIIYSGGLCPKGNTGLIGKRAPDYIRIYLNILEEHLKKVSVPIEKYDGIKERVLVPRSLTFLNEQGVFYCSIYHNLGFEVCVSKESDEEISELGKVHSHSEFCYPLILAHGHAAYLKNQMKEKDKLLLVGAISKGEKNFKFCPYVASSGHVIMGNLDLEENKVLIPIIRFENNNYPIYKAVYNDLKRVFGKRFSEKEVRNAVKKAEADANNFLNEVHKKGEEILVELKERGEKTFIGIGRGYTIFDSRASSNVHELFALNGLHFIPTYFINLSKYNVDKIVENMFWYQGRKILEQMWYALAERGFFPVRLTNFNCGPDSIIYYHEEKLANEFNKPWLVLETDGHNSNAQFGTRILAHNRVIDKYIENPVKSRFEIISKEIPSYEGRIIGLPYMGDGSGILAATLRAIGFNSVVMPTRTNESIEIAKKIVNTNTCQPFSFQVGDQLAWLESLKKKGINPNEKAAILMPSASGPCRFGQYSVVLRKFFDEGGFDKVPMISPSSEKNYADADLPKKQVNIIVKLSFKGMLANELLKSCLLRCRPYEINKGESDRLYKKVYGELIKLIETNPSAKEIKKFLREKLEEFIKIKKDDRKRFPMVLLNGEIFVRNHEISNQDSIRLLEKHKLEVILEPIFSWIDYINKIVMKRAFEKGDFLQFGFSLLKKAYMKNVSKELSAPFDKFLVGRESHDPFHLIESMEKNLIYDSAIQGESCISIGGAYAFIKDELPIDGIYHVGPLGCMHETITTSRVQSLINKERMNNSKLIPFMDAVFGESPTPNLDSQIGIFAQNCWLRKEMGERINKNNCSG